MKKKTLIIIGVIIVITASVAAFIFRPSSPSETVSLSSDGLNMTVSYSRPYKKGRIIFGDSTRHALVPFGQVWRLGANKATEISFDEDIKFGGKAMKLGSYRMYAIPGEDTWQIVLNSELGKSGSELPDRSKDVLIVDIEARNISTEIEQFTILLESKDSNMVMKFLWDRTEIAIPITH